MKWIGSSKFPASSKFANVTLVIKQGSGNLRENERPISILPIILKTFGKLICGQLSNHFDNILAKFRNSHRSCSVRKCVLRNFTKFTGKHLSQSIFLNEVDSFKISFWRLFLKGLLKTLFKSLLTRDSGTGVFLWISWNFWEHLFYRTPLGNCFCN